MLNVVYMGTPDYADEILKKLIGDDRFNVSAVFTQPDKKVGRKQILTPPIVKETAVANNIEVYQPEVLKEEENVKILKNLQPDFIVVAAYGQLLSREILDIAPCVNLHASILPKYRGASPIQSAILEGDELT
ncbi:MAG: formyltransferase family protein, partial [Campylobacterales bacterium]|nr:formyltransferase family protein [Campylobacterales bacterium]